MAELILPGDGDRDAWLAARGHGIGASEIAAVLGLSPWQSAFGLYWIKAGVLGGELDSERLEWGHRLEEPIAAKFADDHPDLGVRESGLYRSTVRPWQIATPDREVCDYYTEALLSALECKSDNSFDGWGEHGSDEIPVYYRCQLLWQIDVLDLDVGYVAVLFSGRTYREYVIERDEQDLAVMREAGAEFWRRVQDEDPPGLDAHQATTEALKALHPDLDDTDVEVPAHVAEEYRAAVDAHRAAEKRKDAATNELRAFVGTGRYALDPDGEKVATRVVYDRDSLDTKALRVDHRDLCAEYTTTTTVEQIRSAGKKSKPKTIREAVSV